MLIALSSISSSFETTASTSIIRKVRHKARVFLSSLGIATSDADSLRGTISQRVLALEATPTERDEFGQRYIVDIPIAHYGRSAVIRTAWIVRTNEDVPRLTTCAFCEDDMNLLQVVALTDDIPEKGLKRGQVGTIVEQLAADTFEIEFADLDGKPYAFAAVSKEKLLALRHERLDAAA
jgi:Domain of unknown function (DUF4926)